MWGQVVFNFTFDFTAWQMSWGQGEGGTACQSGYETVN